MGNFQVAISYSYIPNSTGWIWKYITIHLLHQSLLFEHPMDRSWSGKSNSRPGKLSVKKVLPQKGGCLFSGAMLFSVKVVVDWCFGARWFRIRIGIPQSNNPFHKGISGFQTTGPQTNNEPLVDSTFWKKNKSISRWCCLLLLPSLKLTASLPLRICGWETILSFWEGPFSGLVLGRVLCLRNHESGTSKFEKLKFLFAGPCFPHPWLWEEH